ncbi:hypothetical protein [Spiroplasma taiwanense]|nr:hypothetical protein [Spiroplasma taiwanense]
MSKNKYFPKTFRKGLIEFLENIENYKKQIADLENNFKFSNKDFNNNPEIIYNSIEISLIAKLLSFVNILDLYIEICNLFLEIMYFEIVNLTYTNLFNFLENIDNTIPYLVKIFLGLSKKIKNSIEFSTLMNKMISFDNNLVKLSEELNIKIVNYK